MLGYDRTFSRAPTSRSGSPSRRDRARWSPTSSSLLVDGGVQRHVPRPQPGRRRAGRGQPARRRSPSTLGQVLRRRRRTSRRCGGRRRDWLIRPGVRADVYARRDHDEARRRSAPDRPLQAGRARPARRRAGQRRQRGLAQGERRHLPPAAALRAAAARPRHDAAQVRPLALVPDEPRRRGAARENGSSSSAEGFFNYMDPTIFDLSVNDASVVTDANRTLVPTSDRQRADRRAGVHRSPDQAADRARVRPRGAAAPAGEDGRVRLGLVHAVALGALARRRVGAVRLRSHAPGQRRRRAAAAPQLGRRRAPAVPERPARPRRPPATTPRAATATCASTCASTSAPSGATWLLDFYVDITNVALLPEEVTAGHGHPLRAAHGRPARPVLTGDGGLVYEGASEVSGATRRRQSTFAAQDAVRECRILSTWRSLGGADRRLFDLRGAPEKRHARPDRRVANRTARARPRFYPANGCISVTALPELLELEPLWRELDAHASISLFRSWDFTIEWLRHFVCGKVGARRAASRWWSRSTSMHALLVQCRCSRNGRLALLASGCRSSRSGAVTRSNR